jgi:nicotinate (nicotinamide) nucleotide adenylyltransferase
MEFLHRAPSHPTRLAVFPGAFNPPTTAHLALAHAALSQADEVVLVLPRLFPHKPYHGAPFEERVEMLREAVRSLPSLSVAVSDGGLFIEIAAECRAAYAGPLQLSFLCGRDAAERIAAWDYGRPGAFPEMLRHFDLLVAARQGEYEPPPALRAAIRRIEVAGEFNDISASDVRRRISLGEPWEHLVPPEIHSRVRKIYSEDVSC